MQIVRGNSRGTIQRVVTFSYDNAINSETTKEFPKKPIKTLFGHSLLFYDLSSVKIDNKKAIMIILVRMDLGTNSPVLI